MPPVLRHHGGSFAPPLSDDLLAKYESLATNATPLIRDGMLVCLKAVKKWWNLPESSKDGAEPHKSGRGTIIPLDHPIQTALWDDIPWEDEINVIQARFDSITNVELRNAAFHLLWFLKELNLDREPITNDTL